MSTELHPHVMVPTTNCIIVHTRRRYAAFTPDTCSRNTSCIHLYRRLHVSCIGDKTVVTATCIDLYQRVEHCLELVSGYMTLYLV